MLHKNVLKILFILAVFLLASCRGLQDKPAADMPNPASVFCEENGGKLEIRSDESGAQSGVCVFDDGSECDEWAFYRGECKSGDSLESQESNANLPNPASVFCEENKGKVEIITAADGSQFGRCVFQDGSSCEEWAFNRGECKPGEDFGGIVLAEDGCRLYQNVELGYSVHFPADAIVTFADDPSSTLTIQGPLVDDEYWPMIYINHPQDRVDFKPPLDVDLEEWLKQNSLLVEERLADGEIAGELSIHTRHARSDQSYASDTFWFAHDGQIYNIMILHTGDKEDWVLYDHFLQSFSFDPVLLYP
jgi:putative hemolysin